MCRVNPKGGTAQRALGFTQYWVNPNFYTILPSPKVYGVWHTKGGSVGGCTLRNGRAIVLP